ncbi:MerR family transcriptional regulator [Micromonospora narathiwatensis]|uniref:DNA-binding transcriptional regulator, MerR family n=1 Tax=Micromonospora narathiwatensis TaxID=299146 RepID=A0A1A8ZSD7_9ACTN|nr:MerR family transcriptional regulator [Micromonospora narathiwatensis]SBT46739.1 DNA-binding transcriptional regulator, MerR family [Micromonospora narathiwatensis]
MPAKLVNQTYGGIRLKIVELSRRAELPVPTIKFYLREGLLPPGRTAPGGRHLNYDERHLSRLMLIRTLTAVGRLSLASVREVLHAVDSRGLQIAGLCAVINDALFAEDPSLLAMPERQGAAARIDSFIDVLGWRVAGDSPGRHTLARVLTALERLTGDTDVSVFAPYAEAAMCLTTLEAASLPSSVESDNDRATLIARVVLLEAAMAALRRLAREHLIRAADRVGAEPT